MDLGEKLPLTLDEGIVSTSIVEAFMQTIHNGSEQDGHKKNIDLDGESKNVFYNVSLCQLMVKYNKIVE